MYTLWENDHENGTIKLNVPGEHNVLNSLAAVVIGLEMGLSFSSIQRGISTYKGVRRRFDIMGCYNNIMKSHLNLCYEFNNHKRQLNYSYLVQRFGFLW